MRLSVVTAAVIAACATAAIAHTGVKNPAVKARMDLMVEIKDATAVLGDMAKGARAFDAAAADAARAALERHAAEIPPLFEAQETDPMSEALPTVWTDWDGFVAASAQMEDAAASLDIASLDTLRAGMGPLGQSCSACHEDYRIEK